MEGKGSALCCRIAQQSTLYAIADNWHVFSVGVLASQGGAVGCFDNSDAVSHSDTTRGMPRPFLGDHPIVN